MVSTKQPQVLLDVFVEGCHADCRDMKGGSPEMEAFAQRELNLLCIRSDVVLFLYWSV